MRYLRLSQQDDSSSYVTGMVWAEMKKSVGYRVDIKLHKEGVVMEAQCECGAGQGPTAHCKHVGCILYGLQLYQTAKYILCEQTCTQVRLLYDD